MVFFVADSSTGDLSTSVEPQRKQDEDQRPFAGRAAHLERPAPGLRPVAEAIRPEPRAGSAPPAPSSRIDRRRLSPRSSAVTHTTEACACLVALVSASETT